MAARGSTPKDKPRHLVVPDWGVGAGLRSPHFAHIEAHEPKLGFFEALSDNYLGQAPRPREYLGRIGDRYPVVLHGVGLGIGGPDEPSRDYLRRLKDLSRQVRPAWITDHFCFSGVSGALTHDLLPLPYTEECIARVARRAKEIQDFLELPFGLENTSSYLSYQQSQMTEWDFISEVLERADCGLLLDVNNIYVSAYNHGYDALEFLESIPHERVIQIHLAGHTHKGDYLLDTHRGPSCDEVLELYERALALTGPVSTLLEWDDQIPEFPVLMEELLRIQARRDAALRQEGAQPSEQVA